MKSLKCSTIITFCFLVLVGSIFLNSKTISAATIQDMKNKFPNGAYWNHVVKSGHGYSNYQDYGSCNNPNGYTWTPCNTHNGNVGVGGYDCNSFSNAMQCCGFAKKLAYDLYGSTHSSWGTTTLANAKVGDVMHYYGGGADATYGHWVMIIGKSGNTLTFGECNAGGNCLIRWGRTLNVSKMSSYTIYSAPWAATLGGSSTTPSAPAATVTFKDQNINHTWDTNAEIYVKVMNPNRQSVSRVGCYLYNESGTLLYSYYENCSYTSSYVNYNCNFNNDMKYTLKPGTTYKYVTYAIVGGVEYKDSMRSFKTTGNSDTTKPVITDVSVTNFDGDGFTVKCKATDNVGVVRVQFPTWTAANGQDDIQKDWGINSAASGTKDADGYYTYRVNLSDHNLETGIYHTHIYAYDAAGNSVCVAVPSTTIPKYYLTYCAPTYDAVAGRDACVIEFRATMYEETDFEYAKVVTYVIKGGEKLEKEKTYSDFTVGANRNCYFTQLIDRSDYEDYDGVYVTTCYLKDSSGNEVSLSCSYTMTDLQNNLYTEANVGDQFNIRTATGLISPDWTYSISRYIQSDIAERISEVSADVVSCKKAGRTYIMWENTNTGERYLQILDIKTSLVLEEEPEFELDDDWLSNDMDFDEEEEITEEENDQEEIAVEKITPPTKVKGLKLTKKKKAVNTKWKSVSDCDGYQIICSRTRKFKSKKTIATQKTSAKFKGLKKKKTYYVKVRAYVISNGEKIYGKWSTIKKCKTR